MLSPPQEVARNLSALKSDMRSAAAPPDGDASSPEGAQGVDDAGVARLFNYCASPLVLRCVWN